MAHMAVVESMPIFETGTNRNKYFEKLQQLPAVVATDGSKGVRTVLSPYGVLGVSQQMKTLELCALH